MDNLKLKAVLLFILDELGIVDYYKLFKIVYFADKEHLFRYGRAISNDKYVVMGKGPVPSRLYDEIKAIKNRFLPWKFFHPPHLYHSTKVDGYLVKPLEKPDLDQLSKSEIECLKKSISENKDLTFGQLVDKSHDSAFIKAEENNSKEISKLDMAKDLGASPEMLEYISEIDALKQAIN